MNRLSVLGGSSPFTVSLIDELDVQNTPPHVLALHGRDSRSLNLVAEYARCKLNPRGWDVLASTEIIDVLNCADIVLHQIRYGDMRGRAMDEYFAQRMDIAADETLGPAALRRVLLLRQPLKRICEQIVQTCPNAWVINLTNPLSLVTSLMTGHGITRCVGLCELPKTTAETAIQQLELSPHSTQWSYAGLNHRGFVVGLKDSQTDSFSQLGKRAQNSGCNKIVGFPIPLLLDLQAIPTKYFHLMQGTGSPAAGRAASLTALRTTLFRELEQSPDATPASLGLRNTDWYRFSVVPLLNALTGTRESVHVVNLTASDGITREALATVSNRQIKPHQCPRVPEPTQRWIDRYEAHEQAMLELVRHPGFINLENAVAIDPLIPQPSINRVASAAAIECEIT